MSSPCSKISGFQRMKEQTKMPKSFRAMTENQVDITKVDPVNMIKITITMLFSCLKTEGDSEYRSFYVKTIKELIELNSEYKYYNVGELQDLFKEMLHLLSGSFVIVNDLQGKLNGPEDAENHELSFLKNLMNTEEINLNMYGAIFHSIFSVYNESVFDLAKFLFENVAEKITEQNETHIVISTVC